MPRYWGLEPELWMQGDLTICCCCWGKGLNPVALAIGGPRAGAAAKPLKYNGT